MQVSNRNQALSTLSVCPDALRPTQEFLGRIFECSKLIEKKYKPAGWGGSAVSHPINHLRHHAVEQHARVAPTLVEHYRDGSEQDLPTAAETLPL